MARKQNLGECFRKNRSDTNIVGISLLIMCGMGFGGKLVGSQRLLQKSGRGIGGTDRERWTNLGCT